MSEQPLVLSLFPGIGLLDHAFEIEGFCVVRGPDVLWGGDIKTFHAPAGHFNGVIGGPPCQAFSRFIHLLRAQGKSPRHGNLIPEYERVVFEAQPDWFVMENVPHAPEPSVDGYSVHHQRLNNRWLGEEQHRIRRFSFGTPGGVRLDLGSELAAIECPQFAPALVGDARATPVAIGGSGKRKPTATVISGNGFGSGSDFYAGHPERQVRRTIADACVLQGLPPDFMDAAPFTQQGKLQVLANGVPIPMGRAIARAVRRALGLPILSPAPPSPDGREVGS